MFTPVKVVDGENKMEKSRSYIEEKRILRLIYAITLIAFLIIALYNKDWGAVLFGVFLIVLAWYSHFIINKFFPDGDKYLLVLSIFLSDIGLIMIYRIKPILAVKQLTWFSLGIGIFMLIVILLPDIESIAKFKYVYMAVALCLLGSKNWIDLGFTSFQPSEFAKVFIILYLASVLCNYNTKKELVIPGIVIMVSLILLVMQKDLGTAIIFFGISVAMVYVGTSDARYVLMSMLLFFIGGIGSFFAFSHVRVRVNMWLNPWSDPNHYGYQIIQSLYAISSGGFLGTGLCLGHPNYIPAVSTDLIFSIICEELGLLGGFAIIITYFLLIYRGFRTAIYAEGAFSKLTSVGISTMIGAQVFVIIGGVIKLIPLTGITMPFISYGGSSMIINFISLGILQKISESYTA